MTDTATVETLTAEVRVLMVGNRQITLSVARQLDTVKLADLEPFGRVRLDKDRNELLPQEGRVIGRDKNTGSLALATYRLEVSPPFLGLEDLGKKITICGTTGRQEHYYGYAYLVGYGRRRVYFGEDAIDKCGVEGHRPGAAVETCGKASTNGLDRLIQEKLTKHDAAEARHKAAAALPLIVLAGLR